MSIARFYGGIKAYGAEYKYVAESDMLVESAFMKWVVQRDKGVEKAKRESEKAKWMKAQQELPL